MTAPEAFPARHCSPIDGTLCLLGRDSSQWVPSLTLRRLLDEKLEDALNGTGIEDPQGEPVEFWWNSTGLPDSYCLVDSSWRFPESAKGMLTLTGQFQWDGDKPLIRAVVTAIHDDSGRQIACWEGPVPPDLQSNPAKTLAVPWFRKDEPLMPAGTYEQITELAGQVPQQKPFALSLTHYLRCFAILYEAELGHDQTGLSFTFPVLFGSKKQMQGRDPRKAPKAGVVRALRAGAEDLGARVPAVKSLHEKKIAVFGLGALGAPLAVELARNGCRVLHLIDHDIVEPGNSIRWPLGASAWGRHKARALADFISREYPGTSPVPLHHHIGLFSDADPAQGDAGLFAAALEDVDLAVDAAASHGVTGILGDYCRDRGIPMITLFASPNLEGGLVARFVPESGCPTCLEKAWKAKELERPRGFGLEAGLQQPLGCAERTFTGASYDLQELSLQAMRMIIQTIDDPAGAAESFVLTLRLADDNGPIPPQWAGKALPAKPECTCNNKP